LSLTTAGVELLESTGKRDYKMLAGRASGIPEGVRDTLGGEYGSAGRRGYPAGRSKKAELPLKHEEELVIASMHVGWRSLAGRSLGHGQTERATGLAARQLEYGRAAKRRSRLTAVRWNDDNRGDGGVDTG
jgi:hypothetical protein